MRRITFHLFFVAIAFATLSPAYAVNWEKLVNKIEEAEQAGDYAKATKFINKLAKKAAKKLGENHQYTPYISLKKAEIALYCGEIVLFQEKVEDAISKSITIHSEDSRAHATLLIQITESYITYGNPLKALGYFEEAVDILSRQSGYEDSAAYHLSMLKAEILMQQGEYRNAILELASSEEYFINNTADRISYVDESGKLISEKIDKDRLEQNLRNYAEWLNLKARVLHSKGDFISADSAFLYAGNWIDDKLGKRDINYALNQYYLGRMLADNGVGDISTKYLESSYFDILKVVEPTHFQAIEVRLSLIKHLILQQEEGKLSTLTKDTEKVFLKNLDKEKSLWVKYLKYLSALYRIEQGAKVQVNIQQAVFSDASGFLLANAHPYGLEYNELIYQMHLANEDMSAAMNTLNQNVQFATEITGENSLITHLHKLYRAEHLSRFTDQIAEATDYFNNSFQEVVKPRISFGHKDYVRLITDQAYIYQINDRFEDAATYLEEALLATRRKYDNRDIEYGKTLEKIARLYIDIGEYQKAGDIINDAIDILEGYGNSDQSIYTVMAYETKARLLGILADFDAAEDMLKDAEKLKRRSKTNKDYNEYESYELLARLNIELGKYIQTESYLDQIIDQKIKVFGARSRFLVRPRADRSLIHLAKGEYTEAENEALLAYDVASNIYGDNSTQTAYAARSLEAIYNALGNYEKAEELIQQILPIYREKFGKDHIEVGNALSDFGLVQYYKNEIPPDEILVSLNTADKIIADAVGKQTTQYAELLKRQAMVYIRKNNPQKALELLEASERIWKSKAGKRNNIKTADISMLIGDVHYFQKDYREAENFYKEAAKLFEDYFNDDNPEYVKALSRLSKVYYMQGDKRRAKASLDEVLEKYREFIKIYFSSLSEREKTKYWNTIKDDFEFYATMALELGNDFTELIEGLYNNALLTKALLLNSSIKIRNQILGSGDPELIAKYEEWVSKKELLTTALSMSTDQLSEERININSLAGDVERIEKDLSRLSDAFGKEEEAREVVTWEEIHAALEENEVAMEVIRFRYFDHVFTDSVLYALVYVREGRKEEPRLKVLPYGTELEGRYLTYYRNVIKYRVEDSYSNEKYWQPIRQELGDFSKLYFSPDGAYTQINLEAIPIGRGQYVLDSANIILVNNTKDLYNTKNKSREEGPLVKSAMLFGNPEFYVKMNNPNPANTLRGEVISDLPGTEVEIKSIYSILEEKGWDISFYLDTAASEDRVKRLMNPRVFHIATHGFFTPAPEIEQGVGGMSEAAAMQNPLLRSGLLLTGAGDLLAQTLYNYNIESGVLTAYEAMNMSLDNTELVVLSACETGLGDVTIGEGVYGLQRAFLVAGAENLIMSLFKVSDEATQELMTAFYEKWLETGDKRTAFIEAKKEIREKFKDPLFWGAFVMIGI